MFDLPIVVVKGGNSILDFFDHELIKFTPTGMSICASDAETAPRTPAK